MNGCASRLIGFTKRRLFLSWKSSTSGRRLGLMLSVAALVVLCSLVFVACGEGETATTQASDTTTGAATSVGAADGQVYEFKLSLHNPDGSVEDQFCDAWAQKVDEATDGRVKVTVFPGAVLGNPADGLTMVKTGICDILWSFTGFFPAEFKANSVLSLPLLLPGTSQENTAVFWDLIESRPEILEEFEDQSLKLLEFHAGPTAILGSNKLVASVDDLKNLQLRVGGGPLTDAVVAWGVSPIAMPPTDLYESLQKNVIDGYIFDPAGVLAYKAYEPVEYFLDLPFNANPLFTVMNLDKWNQLPADLQELVTSVSGRLASDEFAEMQDASTAELWAAVEEAGKTITVPTQEVMAGFQPGADEAISKWVEEKSADGIDADGLVRAVGELVEKNVKE